MLTFQFCINMHWHPGPETAFCHRSCVPAVHVHRANCTAWLGLFLGGIRALQSGQGVGKSGLNRLCSVHPCSERAGSRLCPELTPPPQAAMAIASRSDCSPDWCPCPLPVPSQGKGPCALPCISQALHVHWALSQPISRGLFTHRN